MHNNAKHWKFTRCAPELLVLAALYIGERNEESVGVMPVWES